MYTCPLGYACPLGCIHAPWDVYAAPGDVCIPAPAYAIYLHAAAYDPCPHGMVYF